MINLADKEHDDYVTSCLSDSPKMMTLMLRVKQLYYTYTKTFEYGSLTPE